MIFPTPVPFNSLCFAVHFDLVLPILMPLIVVSYPDRITEVKTNIYVTSFGPVSDTDMVRGATGCVFSLVNSPTSLLLQTHGRSTPHQTLRTKRCFFCCIFIFIAAFPSFIIASSLSLSLSTHNTILKWDEFSTRQHDIYSSDNFHLINYFKCPLVILVTPLFILGSPVYHSEACAHLHIISSASPLLLKTHFPSD